MVLGFGGYVSTPAYLAARRLGIPIVVHEQNVLPGLANKLAARITPHVYTSFPQTPLPHAELHRAAAAPRHRRSRPGGAARPGPGCVRAGAGPAHRAGQRRIPGRDEHQQRHAGRAGGCCAAGIQVLHVVGPKNLGRRRTSTPAPGRLRRWAFVEQMELAYAAADLMLGRCGGGTVREPPRSACPPCSCPTARQRRAGPQRRTGGEGRWRTVAGRRGLHAGVGGATCPALLHDPDRLAGMHGDGPARCCGTPTTRLPPRAGVRARRCSADGVGPVRPMTGCRGRARPGALHRHRRIGDERDRLDHDRPRAAGQRQRRPGLDVPQSLARSAPRCMSATGPSSSRTPNGRRLVGHPGGQPRARRGAPAGLRVLHRSAALGSLMLGRRGSRWPVRTARPRPRR